MSPFSKALGATSVNPVHKRVFSPNSKHRQPVIQGIEHSPKHTTCDQDEATGKGLRGVMEATQAAKGRGEDKRGQEGMKTSVLCHRIPMDRLGLFLKGFAFLSGKRFSQE